jgi:L-asparaginase II
VTIGSVRSGLTESFHPVSAVALDPDGRTIATWGDGLDREFFLRSAPKALQAGISQRNGAALVPEQLAIAASSHSAFPVHVAYVDAIQSAVSP